MGIKKALLALILVLVVIFLFFVFKDKLQNFFNRKEIKKGPSVSETEIFDGVSYEAIDPNKLDVSILVKNLFSPTRIKITPNGRHLLVSQLTGEVLAIDRTSDGWSKEPYLVTKVETKFPGFPPEQAGLVGMIFSSEFEKNGKLFLLYTYQDKDKKVQNRISVVTLKEAGTKLEGTLPKQIFQANVVGSPSHQITDGISLEINGEPKLLFLIGEGFDATRAQNPSLEAGKAILIKEDGTERKIVALGLRNSYVFAKNPFDKEGRILISDTGPDKYDRLIYTDPLKPIMPNFGWDGNQEKLALPIPDPNFKKVSDMVIFRFMETKTFVGLAFRKDGNFLATLFGKTGEKENTPGKEIVLGKIANLEGQPHVSFETIVRRNPKANGKFGNPIGLEIDEKTGDFFFADIMEGRTYQVKEKGGG